MRALVYSVILSTLAASASASDSVPVNLHPLRDECVRMRVHAETRAFRWDEEIPYPDSRDFVCLESSYGGNVPGPEPEPGDSSKTKEAGGEGKGILSMTFWLEERKKAISFLSRVSTRLPHQWDASVCVDWRDIDSFRLKPGMGKRQNEADRQVHAAAKERPDRLGRIVIPKRKSTVGDALQTIADILVLDVSVMPTLTQPYGPDWGAVLKLPLKPTDVHRRDGLSVQALMDHVAQRLQAVADFRFNSLLFDDEKAAEERRRQDEIFGVISEELDGDEGEAPTEEHRPPQGEEGTPAVAPE